MFSFLATASDCGVADACFDWLTENSFKSSVVLLLAVGTVLCLRGAAPRSRYQLLSLAFVGILALPVLSHILPTWSLPILCQSEAIPDTPRESVRKDQLALADPATELREASIVNEAARAPGLFEGEIDAWDEAMLLGLPLPKRHVDDAASVTAAIAAPPAPASSPQFGPSWAVILVSIWAVGIGLVLAWLAIGLWRVRSLTLKAKPLNGGSWPSLMAQARERIGLTRPFRLLCSEQVTTPMTWGARRPVVLLPAAAVTWSEERRKLVLFHEIVHVKRFDWAIHTLVLLTAAVHWFNPLIWIAGRELAVERERACDDEVIGLGTKASVYATHLVEIARSLTTARHPFGRVPAPALAMASRSRLELRLETILRKPSPPPVRLASVSVTTLLCLAIVIVGTLQPATASVPDDSASREQPPTELSRSPADPPFEEGAAQVAGARESKEELDYDSILAPAPVVTRDDAFKLMNMKQWLLAAMAFEHLAEAAPENGETWFYLGYSLHNAKLLEQAVKIHAKAAQFPKYRVFALYNVACAQALLGRDAQAMKSLERAVEAGFDDIKLINYDPDLRSIRRFAGFQSVRITVARRCRGERPRPDF